MVNNPVLRLGARGRYVQELQFLLNEASQSSRLAVDGQFGRRTEQVVLEYQQTNWLESDGVVGTCTWNALLGNETYSLIHRINLVAQPTPVTCWAASTAMLLNRSRPVSAPPGLLAADGGLLNDSELDNPVNMLAYCRHFNLQLYYPQSYTAEGLYSVLSKGPVMANLLWDVEAYRARRGSSGHMIVIAGLRGDGNAAGTTLRIYNPLPVGSGTIVSINYDKLMHRLPTATYHLYQKK